MTDTLLGWLIPSTIVILGSLVHVLVRLGRILQRLDRQDTDIAEIKKRLDRTQWSREERRRWTGHP